MAVDEAKYAALAVMKEDGADAVDVYAAARQHGLEKIDSIRVLRKLFALGLEKANAVTWKVDGRPDHRLPVIETRQALEDLLKQELGFCGCAAAEAAEQLLYETLSVVSQIDDSYSESGSYTAAVNRLESTVRFDEAPGLSTWFLYLLDDRGFIWHGHRVTRCGLTPRGRELLELMTRFPRPM